MKQLANNCWLAAFLTTACAVVVKRANISHGEHLTPKNEHPPLHPAVRYPPGDQRREELATEHPGAESHPSEAHGHEKSHGEEEHHEHETSHGTSAHQEHEASDGHDAHHEHETSHGHEEAHHPHHHPGEGHLGSHQEHAHDPEAFGLACFLMGGVAAVMMVFYLVNNETVQGATWKVLNMTASIFVAVLVYGTIKGMILDWAEPDIAGEVCIILGLFLVFFLGMHYMLYKVKMLAEEGENDNVEGVAILAAHVTGFAAMYGFADAVELKFFEELGGWGPLLLVVLAVFVLVTVMSVMGVVMQKVADADGEVDENEWKWMELCTETDDDVFCLTMSFLITLYIRYLIRGKNHPYEPGHTGEVVQSDCTSLYFVAVSFVLVVLVGTLGHLKVHVDFKTENPDKHLSDEYPNSTRAMDVTLHCSFMVCAWCFLFWGEWQLYVLGWDSTVIGGCLVVAVVLTLFSFGSVLVMYYFIVPHVSQGVSRALKSFELSLGILVGFSWERCFDVGFEEVEIYFEHRKSESTHFGARYLFYALNILLFVIVAPAWRLYIFPKAKKFEEEEHNKAKIEKEALVQAKRWSSSSQSPKA